MNLGNNMFSSDHWSVEIEMDKDGTGSNTSVYYPKPQIRHHIKAKWRNLF